jgi:hypothetical protein
MPDPIGYRRWALMGGQLTTEDEDCACILNASNDDANVDITIFFADREPAPPRRVAVPARRTVQLRFSEIDVPPGADYGSLIESDVPVVVQHSRSRAQQFEYSTIAYAGD